MSSKSHKSSNSKSFHKNANDWICSDKSCKNLNFARRESCNRCKRPREDDSKKKSVGIGSSVAKSSKGLFSADDWACSKCGNINWARRNQCNICNAKKFLEEDERTGLGGGFMEREKVEYKKRHSSESSDEYDEFGRKKKNVRRKVSSDADLKRRKSRRDRSSSSSSSSSSSDSRSTSSSSRSNSPSNKYRKISRRSRSSSRERVKHRKSSSDERRKSSRDSSSREKDKSKSPSKSESESEESEESGDDEDLSKYNLFDDDIDIEALKANK